jgi:hypothetical protein
VYRLRHYDNPIEAQDAAMYLLRHGVLASVVGDHTAALGPYAGFTSRHGVGQHTVAIALERQRELATELLVLLEAEPASFEHGWEELSVPDLGGIDPSLLPPCPGCGTPLPADATVENCPACGFDVDVLAIIATLHGPETIEALLDSHALVPAHEVFDDEMLSAMAADCGGCGYPLDGLPRVGACPECGRAYDKARIVDAVLRQRSG